MKLTSLRSIMAIAGLVASVHAHAQSPLKLFPIPGVFLPPKTERGGMIHPDFLNSVDPAKAGKLFDAEFRRRFPEAVAKLVDKDKWHTLVSSLQIGRASLYGVDKVDGTSDIFVPVSGSLYFTNVVTGEVLYTVSATYYYRATVAGSSRALPQDRVQEMFSTSFNGLVSELMERAGKQFNPRTISANVKAEWKGLYVLDKGLEQGLAKGDTISDVDGNALDVIYSASTYAVAAKNIGNIDLKRAFSRVTNASPAENKRPRVMVLVDQSPEGYSPEMLRLAFADVLGAKAPISVVHVNRQFAEVLSSAFSGGGLSSENSRKRELPDYFVRISVPEVRSFEMPTSLKHKTKRSYRTFVTAELLDRNGRVVFATDAQDRIDDEVTAGMSFDATSRREVSVRNALLAVAEKLGAGLKFNRLELPLNSTAPLEVADRHDVLNAGDVVTVFRNAGNIAGITGEVQIPIQTLSIDSVGDGKATAAFDLPLTSVQLPLVAADKVVLEAGLASPQMSRKRFAACGPAVQLGDVALPAFGAMAINAFQHHFKAPFYTSEILPQVQNLLGTESRFKTDFKSKSAEPDFCVEPVYRVNMEGSQCTDGDSKICTDNAMVRITLRIKRNGALVSKSGLETKLTTAGYLQDATLPARQDANATDLLLESSKLARDIAEKLNKEKLDSI